MSTNTSLVTASGLGFATGLRSMLPAAVVARELAGRGGPEPGAGRLERGLSRRGTATALAIMAAGELVADKVPGVPARVDAGPLAGRMAIGGLLGMLAGARRHGGSELAAAGAAAGAAGAVIGAFTGWFLRREAARATLLPDTAVALAEDTAAFLVSREMAARL